MGNINTGRIEVKELYCEKCGQVIPDHAVFCGKCGARIEALQELTDEEASEETAKAVGKNTKSRWKLIRLLLLCMVIELVTGSCFMLHNRRVLAKSSKQNREVTEEQNAGIRIGDTVTFGAYEQDNNHSNGAEPLEWIVLDRQDDKVLLLSRYVLDCKQYHETSWCDITWAECSLREWLNTAFYETAFDEEQQRQIMETEVFNQDNKEYDTPGGVTTYDKVFLLSLDEACKYTQEAKTRKAKATAYAMDSELWTNSENYAYWWLRSPGYYSVDAAYVNTHGAVDENGYDVRNTDVGVRPALWVKIEEELW